MHQIILYVQCLYIHTHPLVPSTPFCRTKPPETTASVTKSIRPWLAATRGAPSIGPAVTKRNMTTFITGHKRPFDVE